MKEWCIDEENLQTNQQAQEKKFARKDGASEKWTANVGASQL